MNHGRTAAFPPLAVPELRDDGAVVRWLAEIGGVTEASARRRLLLERFWPGYALSSQAWRRGVPRHVPGEKMDRLCAESDAGLYEAVCWNRTAWKGWIRRWMLRRVGPAQGAPRKILCFGDGIGVESLCLSRLGHEVTYFDVGRPAAAFARRLFEAGKASVATAADLDSLPRGWFDVVVCLDVLEHVKEPGRLAGRLAELLAPGGELIVHAPFGAVCPSLPTHLEENRRYFGDLELFRRAGLQALCANFLWMPIVFRREPVSADDLRRYRMNRVGMRVSGVLMRTALLIPGLFFVLDVAAHVLNAIGEALLSPFKK